MHNHGDIAVCSDPFSFAPVAALLQLISKSLFLQEEETQKITVQIHSPVIDVSEIINLF